MISNSRKMLKDNPTKIIHSFHFPPRRRLEGIDGPIGREIAPCPTENIVSKKFLKRLLDHTRITIGRMNDRPIPGGDPNMTNARLRIIVIPTDSSLGKNEIA